MTTTRIPLRCKAKHCNAMQRSMCQAVPPGTFDPIKDDKKDFFQRCALFNTEHGKTHLDHASRFWAGIHWYRELYNQRPIETG
jgi:hypothetical protein